jgi:hypothetical protein
MQPIQLSGIVRGKTILLEGELGLPDGAQVSLTVTVERVPNAKTAILARFPSELPPEVWERVDAAISEWDRLDRERERDKADLHQPLQITFTDGSGACCGATTRGESSTKGRSVMKDNGRVL